MKKLDKRIKKGTIVVIRYLDEEGYYKTEKRTVIERVKDNFWCLYPTFKSFENWKIRGEYPFSESLLEANFVTSFSNLK